MPNRKDYPKWFSQYTRPQYSMKPLEHLDQTTVEVISETSDNVYIISKNLEAGEEHILEAELDYSGCYGDTPSIKIIEKKIKTTKIPNLDYQKQLKKWEEGKEEYKKKLKEWKVLKKKWDEETEAEREAF